MKELEDGILLTFAEVGELGAFLSMASFFCESSGIKVDLAKSKGWQTQFEEWEKSRKRAEELKQMFFDFYKSKMGI